MNNFIKEDDKQTILIVGDDGTKRYRVRPNQVKEVEEMLSQRRSRPLARPRQIAMYLAKKLTTRSLPEIGRKFANRDHTTVIHAVKTIDRLSQTNEEIRKNVEEIKSIILSD